MKEFNFKDYKKNVFTEINDTWGIIVAGDKNTGINGMTVSWGGLGILWNKPVAYIFVRHSRYTHEFLDDSKSISISFLSDEYKKAKGVFGSLSGRNINKFENTGLTPEYDSSTNTYYIKEADTAFLLKVIYQTEIKEDGIPNTVMDRFYPTKDMHTMYVCEVLKCLEK